MKRICCISDTHSLHAQVKVPKCDILIHAGDFTGNGSLKHLLSFAEWMQNQPAIWKVCIAGNHDEIAEKNPLITKATFKEFGITYLCNESATIDGINIYGSPMTPTFCDWSFMCDRHEIHKYWDAIPENTDILITHGPAHEKLDMIYTMAGFPRDKVGCVVLANRIKQIKPKFHICGHIHASYGSIEDSGTTHVNASICDEVYTASNKPIVIKYPMKKVAK